MNEELSKKIKVLGFFLIIMVTYIHSNTNVVRFSSGETVYNNSLIHNIIIAFIAGGICSVAVPLFFFMSGYLFFYNFIPSPGAYAVKFRRRIFALVIPYVSWSMVGLVIFFILQSIPYSKRFFTHTFIKDLSCRQIFEAIFINPLPNQLWFMRNLILYTLFTPIIYCVLRRISVASMFLIMSMAFMFKRQMSEKDIFFYLLFYLCGCFISIKKINPEPSPSRQVSGVILALWVIFLIINSYFIIVYGDSVTVLINASLIFGIIALWWNYDLLLRWIESRRVFWATSFTFFIYAAHEPLETIYKKTLTYFLKNQIDIGVLLYLITPLMTVATLLIGGKLFKKHFRNTYDFLVGGRG